MFETDPAVALFILFHLHSVFSLFQKTMERGYEDFYFFLLDTVPIAMANGLQVTF
jgi:hypothetical protein